MSPRGVELKATLLRLLAAEARAIGELADSPHDRLLLARVNGARYMAKEAYLRWAAVEPEEAREWKEAREYYLDEQVRYEDEARDAAGDMEWP